MGCVSTKVACRDHDCADDYDHLQLWHLHTIWE